MWRKMWKVAVIIRKVTAKCWRLRSNFAKITVTWLHFFQNYSHFFKLKSFKKLQSVLKLKIENVEICSHFWYFWNNQHRISSFCLYTFLGYEPGGLTVHPPLKWSRVGSFFSYGCLVSPKFFPKKSGFCWKYSHWNAPKHNHLNPILAKLTSFDNNQ